MRRELRAPAVIGVCVVLLLVLYLAVRTAVPWLDTTVAAAVADVDSAVLDRVARGWTRLGDTSTVVVVAVVLALVLMALRDWWGGFVIGLSTLLATSTTALLKLVVTRGRPEIGAQLEETFSWPSGHATAGLVLALAVTVVVMHRSPRWPAIAALVLPVGLGVGVSRVLLSVHWTTDVLAGWLVATISASTVVWLLPDRPQPAAPEIV